MDEGAGSLARSGGRRGGRRARSRDDRSGLPEQRPFHQPTLPWSPTRAVSDDEIEAIHDASLRVLRDVGFEVLHPTARRMLAQHGATVEEDSPGVRFDPDMVTEFVAMAPERFTMSARNPAHDLVMGGDRIAFGSVASAPNVSGLGERRHEGRADDFRKLIRLSDALTAVHFHGGYPVEPVDLHPSVRHLHATFDLLTLSDKVIHTYSLGRERTLDTLEMMKIALGLDDDQLAERPVIFSIVNTSSPLRLDAPMIEGILELSARNQPVVITPFTLAGAMAPVTLAGALVQQNAEALAGIVLTQVARPGAPVFYGGFTSNVDMQSGSPAFGTPEFLRAALIGGQLARRYGVPYRSSNVNSANALDAQAAYESMFSLWGAVMGGANMILHAAGWMEGGLRSSFEKMVMDAELLQMIAAALEPITVDDASLAVEAIAAVGPGGHFFGIDHTQERFRDAFHHPMLSDWRNYESWVDAGEPTAEAKAAEVASALVSAHQPPAFDTAAYEELEDFVARRVAEGGVATNY